MDIIRAWKDPMYRASLSETERQSLPPSPAGFVELSDGELDGADGGTTGWPCGLTITITFEAGCYTYNSTLCNGTCAIITSGCCGG